MSSITGSGTGHIYYNITLTNNDTASAGGFPAVSFTETRNSPFINCPEDYYMSVVRFSLETPTLPVMVCQPVVGSTDAKLLIYQIQLTYKANGSPAGDPPQQVTATLWFVPPDLTTPPPPLPIQANDIENSYYNLYSYNAFILILNEAIARAYNTMGDLPTDVAPPYFSWDTGGNLAILTISTLLTQNTVGNGIMSIGFNTPLFTLFSSFNSQRYQDINNNIFYKIIVDTGPSAIISSEVGPASTTLYFYQVIQEYTTCPLWTPIDSIVFTTSMIPINPELTAAPVVYNNNQTFQSVGTNANLTTILTDFIVPLTTGTEYKPSINYTPAGEYRLVSMFGTSPCSSIQINVYYKNRFGGLIPLTLGFGCSASIKIMFRRKDFGNVILNE